LSKISLQYKQFSPLNPILAWRMDIILASTSPYRRRLLERLQLPFRCVPPITDETPLPHEAPAALAARLAHAKAESIAMLHPTALVIGSDQVASIDGSIIGKPGNFRSASTQLRSSSGREMLFYTAITLISPNHSQQRSHIEQFSVHFRTLSDSQISNYLCREHPYDCAGSFKAEGLGIALFERLTGDDPTSLEGLPLIKLTALLGELGVEILHP
jgi:septum formation protein